MNRNTHKAITSPIVGRCVLLINYVLNYTKQTPRAVKYPYVDMLKTSVGLLFKYAMRQLQGKDYYKRTTELIEEIQSQTYLIYSIGGLTKSNTMKIDVLCDEIQEQLNSIRFSSGQNMKIND